MSFTGSCGGAVGQRRLGETWFPSNSGSAAKVRQWCLTTWMWCHGPGAGGGHQRRSGLLHGDALALVQERILRSIGQKRAAKLIATRIGPRMG